MSQDFENQPEDPAFAEPLAYQQPAPVEQGDSTGGIIPYKNGPALAATTWASSRSSPASACCWRSPH